MRIKHIEVLVKNNKAEQRRSGIDQIVTQLWLPDYDCFRRHRFHTNWIGDYFAIIGGSLLHSDNGDTQSKLALHKLLL